MEINLQLFDDLKHRSVTKMQKCKKKKNQKGGNIFSQRCIQLHSSRLITQSASTANLIKPITHSTFLGLSTSKHNNNVQTFQQIHWEKYRVQYVARGHLDTRSRGVGD